jgi:hypothetical protein
VLAGASPESGGGLLPFVGEFFGIGKASAVINGVMQERVAA